MLPNLNTKLIIFYIRFNIFFNDLITISFSFNILCALLIDISSIFLLFNLPLIHP